MDGCETYHYILKFYLSFCFVIMFVCLFIQGPQSTLLGNKKLCPPYKVSFFFFCFRFEVEECKNCECDYFQTSSSYTFLKSGSKSCGRYTPNYLEFRKEEGYSLSDSSGSTTLYIRFVSDETVHHKGFNFSYTAASATCKLIHILRKVSIIQVEFY